MSNFICSECGMNNIDCGYAGYKTPKEIELEKKLEIAIRALKKYESAAGWGREAFLALKEIEGVK